MKPEEITATLEGLEGEETGTAENVEEQPKWPEWLDENTYKKISAPTRQQTRALFQHELQMVENFERGGFANYT